MPILNYTSEVAASKTIGEIYELVASSGAHEIGFEHDRGEAVAIKFCIIHEGAPLWFRLAPNTEGVLKAMERDGTPPRYQKPEQAHRVSWRILKDAIQAQMALFQANQGEIAEVFLPYAYDMKAKKSVYQVFNENRKKQLKEAPPDA